MRKFNFLFSVLLAVGLLFSTNTWAGNVAKIGSTEYPTLEAAVEAAKSGETIELLCNVEVTEQVVIDQKDIVLDLSSYNITYAGETQLKSGVLQINNGAGLTLNATGGGAIICEGKNSSAYSAITLANKEADDAAATLTMNGGTLQGYYYGITGNGSKHNTIITINGGIVKEGIYLPQVGVTTINGGEIECAYAAIEIRSGELYINGGKFICSATKFSCDANNSGTTTVGAAIAIAQHTTKKDIIVSISGGTFEGVRAINECNPQKNDPAPQVDLSITGGQFTGEIYAQDVAKFLKGGIYTDKTSAETYVADGYQVVANTDEETKTDYPWMIGEATPVAKIGETEYTTLEAAVAAAKENETITLIADVPMPSEDKFLRFADNVTLDLNEHTITSGVIDEDADWDYEDGYAYVYEGKGLTIKNGTMTGVEGKGGTEGYSYAVYIGNDEKDNIPTKDVKIQNVTIPYGGISILGGTEKAMVTIENCEVTVAPTKYYAVYADHAEVIIDGGTYNPGSETKVLYAEKSYGGRSTKMTVLSGSFEGNLHRGAGATLSLKGGIYSEKPETTYVADGYQVVANTDEETKTDYPWMIGVEPVKPLEEVTIDKDVTYTDKDGNTSSVENVATIVSNVVTNNDGTSITQSETGDWKVKTAKPEAGEAQDYSGSSTMVDTKSITVVLTSAVVETNVTISETQYNTVVTSMTFDVTPKVKVITQKTGEAACTTQVEVKTFAEPITFRLPVDKSYAGKYMKVWHQATDAADKTKWDLVGGYLVETTGEGDAMKGYIELAAKEFSFYKVEGNLWQYERTLDGYTIGTICLPRKSCSTSGAKFYRVADKKMNGSEISSIDLEEVQEDLAAGRPYVFIATSGSTKVVVCSEQEEDAVESPEASSANNGLAGTFSELTLSAFSSENQALIFYNDQLYTSVDGDKIPVNCAYILADQIKSTKQNAPRIRLYNMDAQGTTAVDNVVVVEEDAVIYDMLGHRLQEISAPGLYIVNGQKVFIKK